jgi:hypothetical protein
MKTLLDVVKMTLEIKNHLKKDRDQTGGRLSGKCELERRIPKGYELMLKDIRQGRIEDSHIQIK